MESFYGTEKNNNKKKKKKKKENIINFSHFGNLKVYGA